MLERKVEVKVGESFPSLHQSTVKPHQLRIEIYLLLRSMYDECIAFHASSRS